MVILSIYVNLFTINTYSKSVKLNFQYYRCIITSGMSTLFNSEQNINIHISYNLGDNPPLGGQAKKIVKNIKIPSKKAYDTDLKFKKSTQNKHEEAHRHEEDFNPSSSMKNKRKVRTVQSPEIFAERRVKTEHNHHEQFNKKDHFFSSHLHQKNSTSQHHNKSTQQTYPKVGQKKPAKNKNKTHKTSFFGVSTKKPIFDAESLIGTQHHPPPGKKRRVQSAVSFPNKKDLVVDKLLNMSLLGSEMGLSQVVSAENRSGEEKNKNFQKIMKEFLSSLDMHVINHMKEDKKDYKENKRPLKEQDLTGYLVEVNGIPLAILNEKARVIQRCWKAKKAASILGIYKGMFHQAVLAKGMKMDSFENSWSIPKRSVHELSFPESDLSNHTDSAKDQIVNIEKMRELVRK